MNTRNTLLISSVALGCMALAGCGGTNNQVVSSPTPPPPTSPAAPAPQLDTAEVLAIVQTQTSETSEPFQVNAGIVMVIPVDDQTSSPISVDGS